VLGRRKSQYHPASFAKTLLSVRGDGKRYAIVGVPCAMRSARLVADEDSVLKQQLAYFVGIVCGHMKSAAYGESFAWQLGVPPDDLETVDFRIKDPALTSRQYSFGAKPKSDTEWKTAQTLSLVGGNWGHAVFQLNSCNFCDDVFAETADVVFGDAWLSKYEIDWRGTNVVITRNEMADQIIKDGVARKAIGVDDLDIDTVASTQAGNFRHRHEGLAIRLADDKAAGKWTPRKRIQPSYAGVSEERINLIRQRRELSVRSHQMFADAKKAGDLDVYLGAIKPLIDSYGRATKHSFSTRVRNRLQREFWKLARRVRR
jgi:coenzyme F420 hydrogenase subunit beta